MQRARLVAIAISLGLSGSVAAGSLDVTVKDTHGGTIPDAVVYASSASGPAPATKQAVIDQRDKQFVPYVTAVQVGTSILFPNKDNIRHHVYSFSPAKKFELPLYAGTPAAPVVFDKVGFVTLGCNIHDWMVAYVAVLPTPYFQVTGADGRTNLRGVPSGQYTVQVWHPSLRGSPEKTAQHAEIGDGSKELLFTLDLKPDFRAKRAPGLSTGGYR